MARKKKAAEPGFNIFQCQLCADHPQFEQPGAFSTHLEEAHQMDAKAKYQKRMLSHMDASDWYQTDYEFLNNDVVFALQSIRLPRQDKGYWS